MSQTALYSRGVVERTARPPGGMRVHTNAVTDSVWDSIMAGINYFSTCRFVTCDAFDICWDRADKRAYTISMLAAMERPSRWFV